MSLEHQTGNKEFDDLVYVVSDVPQLHRQLSSNKTITETVIKIFKLSGRFNCKLKEIRNNSGQLWVKYKPTISFHENNISLQSSVVACFLKIIADEIEHIPESTNSKRKDPNVIKAAVILAISTGLAINGLSHLMRLIWTNVPFTIDSNQLLVDSIYWGTGTIVSLIIFSVVILGRSTRTHLVIINLLFIGTFGAVSTSFVELRDINIELDDSISTEYEVKVLDKRISKGSEFTSYYLYLNDWNNEVTRKEVEVSNGIYHSAFIGDHLIIKQKDGYLNYRWVEGLEKK